MARLSCTPRWRASEDPTHDLAVLLVPGLPATAGVFRLANMSLSQDAGIVVCGYGKVDGTPFADQGQRMDGAHIAEADLDMVYYPIQTIGGHSGSPVFHGDMVIGVHTRPRIRGSWIDPHQNRGVLLNPDSEAWIVSMSGGGVSLGLGEHAYGPVVAESTYASHGSLATGSPQFSYAQNPVAGAGAIAIADAIQIGLGAAAIVQSGIQAGGGSLSFTYERAERLLTTQARLAMPGAAQPPQDQPPVPVPDPGQCGPGQRRVGGDLDGQCLR